MKLPRVLARVWGDSIRRIDAWCYRWRKRRGSSLVVGLPEEWDRFQQRHAVFLRQFPVLKDACNTAFRGGKLQSLADGVVVGLGRLCAEEFLEILLLCGNGYGFAATKLLRGMYERAVTARYIHGHPEKAEPYVRYSPIQKGKLARALLEQFRNGLSKDRVELLEKALAEAKELRDDYLIACDKCGHQRPSPTWGPDLVTMARETAILRTLLPTCYYEPLLHVHATPHAVETFMSKGESGAWTFDFERHQHIQADNTLYHAHTILLDVLELQRERLNPDGLQAALTAAEEAWRKVWNVPDGALPSESGPA